MEHLETFDALHSVSDLHLGGAPGNQIFDLGDDLATVITTLRRTRPQARVALVLNGDIVDFLAEKDPLYFDTERAAEKLVRIMRDDAFKPVWDALEAFVHTENRHLVLVLGNHDVELALPEVRETLTRALCGYDPVVRARLRFAVDGTGYACLVGGAKVLCIHGNEVDDWNTVDYDRLREIVAASNRGSRPPAWVPNSGTRLVIDVMNEVKKTLRWVDLLKPEGRAVLPLVAVLAKRKGGLLLRSLGALARMVRDRGGSSVGLLGAEGDSMAMSDADAEVEVDLLLEETIAGEIEDVREDAQSLLLEIEELFERRKDGDADSELLDGMLGSGLGSFVGRVEVKDALRGPLGLLTKQFGGFEETVADSDFWELERLVGSNVDFLVAGHTHMAKALVRSNGKSYFNSGTWIGLINVKKWLRTSEAFDVAWARLADGSMEELKRPLSRASAECLLERHPHLVTVSALEGGVVRGTLQRIDPGGNLGRIVRTLPEN